MAKDRTNDAPDEATPQDEVPEEVRAERGTKAAANDAGGDAPERQEGEQAAPGGWGGGGAAERIAALEQELAEAKDQQLRALAEAENARRRAQRDRDDAAKFGATGLARDLLSVADNLRRAIESVPAEARSADPNIENLISGVEMVEREFLSAFEKHRIQKVVPEGEKFDANLHQAMFEVENTGQPPGTVVQVLQPGYVLNGRLLRAAMVGVAKGEPEERRVDTTA